MASKEEMKLREIDAKLVKLRHTANHLFPLFAIIDRKRQMIDHEIKYLEAERLKLTQGQMLFNLEF